MKVSILITSYNTEKYIGGSIESVVSQDLPFDWELLIGDDGSTDGTVGIIIEWIKKYPNNIKVFVHSRNEEGKLGSRAAKNRAFLLERATGDYIHFLDGDDYFLGRDTIKTQVEVLDNPHNSNCSCCAQNMLEYNIPTGKKVSLLKEGSGDRIYDIKKYWSYYYYSTDTILFRKQCKELLLHPLYRDYLNDNFITYLILQYGSVYYQDRVGAQYNQTGDGLWTGHSSVYGSFRNLQLYDLEMDVRQDIKQLNLNKHKSDIRRIRKLFNSSFVEEVKPLIIDLDPDVFKTTLMLYKIEHLTINERLEKFLLYIKADYVYYKSLYVHRFKKFILRKNMP